MGAELCAFCEDLWVSASERDLIEGIDSIQVFGQFLDMLAGALDFYGYLIVFIRLCLDLGGMSADARFNSRFCNLCSPLS